MGGWVYYLAPEVPLLREMPTGPNVFLAMLDPCWLRPCDLTHLKKALCQTHLFGRARDRYLRRPPCLVRLSSCLWCTSVGRVLVSVALSDVASALEISSGLRGPSPEAFTPLRGGVDCLGPETPLLRGMPTGMKVFLAMLDACGLRPCNQTHLKKPLYHTRSFGGARDRFLTKPPCLVRLSSCWVALRLPVH